MSEQPSAIIHVSGPPLTEQQVAELKAQMRDSMLTEAEYIAVLDVCEEFGR